VWRILSGALKKLVDIQDDRSDLHLMPEYLVRTLYIFCESASFKLGRSITIGSKSLGTASCWPVGKTERG